MNEVKALSLSERQILVADMVRATLSNREEHWYGETYVYDDYVVIRTKASEYHKGTYTITDGVVELSDKATWERVEMDWEPAPTGETLVAMGSEVKTHSSDGASVGGYLVVFSDDKTPDLEGDFFTKSTTFDIIDGQSIPIYYLHGQDATLGRKSIGRGTLKVDDVGVWIDAQIEQRDAYEKALAKLAKDGKLGWSSGAAAHLVERERAGKSWHVTQWTIAEASLTPTPAEPRARIMSVKTFMQALAPEARPEASKDAGSAAKTTITVTEQTKEGEMPEVTERMDALESTLKGVGDNLSKVLKYIEDAPAIKDAGYVSQVGGSGDTAIKSLGDYLLAVQRGDTVRLDKVYKSTKALNTQEGSAGGYTVPHEYATQLMQIAATGSAIVSRVRRIPVTAPSGTFPALDQFTAPTAGSGDTALAGGVKGAKRAEGGTYAETEPKFEEINYRLNDAITGLVLVTKEMRADSPVALEGLLTNLIGVAVQSKLEYYILRGNGVGEPLGILNAPAKIDVNPATDNTFAYADALTMRSRFKAITGGVWVMHPGMITDIGAFSTGANSPVTWMQDLAGAPRQALLGYPLLESEHAPNPDTSGCIGLYDLSAYLLLEKGGMYIDFSEHAEFKSGRDAWRFGMRCDGQPWVKGTMTLASPSTFTQSPFVSFND